MTRVLAIILLAVAAPLSVQMISAQTTPAWVATSNAYTNKLVAVEMKHRPESGSDQGLSQFDALASQPTLADEDQERQETVAVLADLKAAVAQQKEKPVAQDLQIVIRKAELGIRREDFARAHEVPFLNASGLVYRGLHTLLDEQTPAERRPAAVIRIREYAGLQPGYKPLADILRQRVSEQMAKPSVIYPAKMEIETELGRNSNYLEGIASLLQKYNLKDWQQPFAQLKAQLTDYDAWTRANVLPKARTDFRLPPEKYALELENYGIDIPPAQLSAMAHQAFTEIQAEMQPIAAQIAQQRHLPSSDYRDVIHELKNSSSSATPSFRSTKIASSKSSRSSPKNKSSAFPIVLRASASPPLLRPPNSPHRICSLRHSCTTLDKKVFSFCLSTFPPQRARPQPKSTTTSPMTLPPGL